MSSRARDGKTGLVIACPGCRPGVAGSSRVDFSLSLGPNILREVPGVVREFRNNTDRRRLRRWTTGRPRRAGNFDAVQVRYGLELAGAASWIMTKLDVLSGLGDIDVVTGYRVNGERFEDYPAHLSTIDEVETEVDCP